MSCHLQSQGGALGWFIGNPTQEYVMFLTEPFLLHSKGPMRRLLISNEYLLTVVEEGGLESTGEALLLLRDRILLLHSLLSPRILLLFFFAAPLLGSSFGRAEGDFYDPTRVTQLSWRHR
ncbi:hypothetical protein C4D60_Mb02t08210 [Musa balbisiana]|uniref:Uncharacterized protein n=1 Tax=Musa balbisiana TaxID=52838 RepID=A0A4S8I950_MUSBA|nr:hypothetical protein C4D60_Mb02t08210 [Musa balbisiana]